MSTFLGLFRHEFIMSIRRTSLWLAYLMVFAFFGFALFAPNHSGPTAIFSGNPPWQEAGETIYLFNMIMPLIAGILSADRLQHDVRLGLRELQSSTPVSRSVYILGKFAGVLTSTLVPMLIWSVALGIFAVVTGQTSPMILWGILAAFVTIAIPSFTFVVAFSLACPLVIPTRVYQILFTGYWFWGNFLSDSVFPTISGTLLNSSGIYALQGFFLGTLSQTKRPPHSALEACMNILVLGLCAAIALFAIDRYLARQTRQA